MSPLPAAENRRHWLVVMDWITVGWSAACALSIGVAIGARMIYFHVTHLPAEVETLVRNAIAIGSASLLRTFTFLPNFIFAFGGFAVLCLARRRWCVRHVDGRIGLHGPWLCLAWTALASGEFVFDFNRHVSATAWLTLPVASCMLWLGATRRGYPRRGAALVWVALAALGAGLASNVPDALGVALWGGWVLILHAFAVGRLSGRDQALLLALGIPAVQVPVASQPLIAVLLATACIAAAVAGLWRIRRRVSKPALAALFALAGLGDVVVMDQLNQRDALAFHGGTSAAPGLAYSFCENPGRGRVFASVPVCSHAAKKCADAHLVEYSVHDWSRPVVHRLFEPGGFWGRIEQLNCIGPDVVVAMCCTKDGAYDDEATVTWSPDRPDRIERHPAHAAGRRIVLDAAHDAIFYLGDHVWRVDRATGRASDALERRLVAASEVRKPPPRMKRMFLAEQASLDSARNRLFIAEFGVGSNVFEVDLDSLEIQRVFRPSGGVTAVAVDTRAGRIWTVGMYGLEIFDVASGALVARRRTGTLPRTPVIDYAHDRIYVPTTIGGRIEVFDRSSTLRLGDIPIGIETRYAFLTGDARWFLATASDRQYVWDAKRLATRFAPTLRSRP